MNKKSYLLLVGCLFIGASHATSTKLCKSLRVRVHNDTYYDCTLSSHYLINGKPNHDTTVPSIIFKGQSEYFDMSVGGNGKGYASNVLTYQCGDENTIGLYSMKFRRRFYGKLVDSTTVNEKNLSATTKYKKEDCDDWLSSVNYNTIEWTIKNQ